MPELERAFRNAVQPLVTEMEAAHMEKRKPYVDIAVIVGVRILCKQLVLNGLIQTTEEENG